MKHLYALLQGKIYDACTELYATQKQDIVTENRKLTGIASSRNENHQMHVWCEINR